MNFVLPSGSNHQHVNASSSYIAECSNLSAILGLEFTNFATVLGTVATCTMSILFLISKTVCVSLTATFSIILGWLKVLGPLNLFCVHIVLSSGDTYGDTDWHIQTWRRDKIGCARVVRRKSFYDLRSIIAFSIVSIRRHSCIFQPQTFYDLSFFYPVEATEKLAAHSLTHEAPSLHPAVNNCRL